MRLQQILTNLISNAIRYTQTGSVTVECHTLESSQWMLAVTDTGIGIPPEDQERIFEPFARVQHCHRPHPPNSTGLGLAIVARLVKLLQGKITVKYLVGVGSTVIMLGDTPYDIESANKAGVSVIAFRCGGFEQEQLKGAISRRL